MSWQVHTQVRRNNNNKIFQDGGHTVNQGTHILKPMCKFNRRKSI